MAPQASNLFMVFNGRFSTLKPIIKKTEDKRTGLAITPNTYNTQLSLNSLPYGKLHTVHNAVEENHFVQNSEFLQSGTSPSFGTKSDNVGGIIKDNTATISPTEVQNNIDVAAAPKATHQILPEVTLNVAGSTFNTIPISVTNARDSEEHKKLLQKAVESATKNSGDERNANTSKKPTMLVLKPVAKAVAGAKGIAIAAPLSRAVVRKGQEVKINFDPDAVAVVGPGGVADAHSDLEISYFEDLSS
jgi:hypothetical protein